MTRCRSAQLAHLRPATVADAATLSTFSSNAGRARGGGEHQGGGDEGQGVKALRWRMR